MWFWIIGAVVVCCIIAAVAQASEDDENKKVAAKRPDALIRLLAEEFPDFSGSITFAKAEAAIKAWDEAIASKDYTRHLKIFDQTQFKNDQAAKEAKYHVMHVVAPRISPDFAAYAINKPIDESFASMNRAMSSSVTLAGQ